MALAIQIFYILVFFELYECKLANPFENNDNLEGITSDYVAEWQWEGWPMKQGSIDAPGARQNAALWYDNPVGLWYLFGGQPVQSDTNKRYSDIWRYSSGTRIWERVFPSQADGKNKNLNKIGGMLSLRANLFDEGYFKKTSRQQNPGVILCGRLSKKPEPKPTMTSPYNFARRKKQDLTTKAEESKTLAVYAPKTTKSNTVWQIDLKDRLWTAYVCCCDSANEQPSKTLNVTTKHLQKTISSTDTTRNATQLPAKINKTEDQVEIEQEHVTISAFAKNKKKKLPPTPEKKKKKTEKKDKKKEDGDTLVVDKGRTVFIYENLDVMMSNESDSNSSSIYSTPESTPPTHATSTPFLVDLTVTLSSNTTVDTSNATRATPKSASKYCPEFSNEGRPVSWCDSEGDALNTVDLSASDIVLWSFNLRTSHWSQKQVNQVHSLNSCAESPNLRHIGYGSQVFIFCDSEDNSTKQVFRLDSQLQTLEALGSLVLPPFLATLQGKASWLNDTETVLYILQPSIEETILVLAYQDDIDLWILTNGSFDPIQKFWRGSALKWFRQYNAPLYNLQFTTESNGEGTVLIVNPRDIDPSEYWPNERGRFIVRIFKNGNLKKRFYDNRTHDQNLTYQHLQSELAPMKEPATVMRGVTPFILCFLGLLAATSVTLLVIRSCVKGHCHRMVTRLRHPDVDKSPPVIRYSVIPDDLLYQVHSTKGRQ